MSKMRKRTQSLRNYLLFSYIPFLLVLILLASAVLIRQFRYDHIRDTLRIAQLGKLTVSDYLDQFIGNSYNSLYRIRLLYNDDSLICDDFLQIFLNDCESGGPFRKVEILDEQGNVRYIYPSEKELQIGMNRAGQDYFRQVQKTNRDYWSSPYMALDSETPAVTLAIPMEKGIIAGDISLKELSALSLRFSENFGNHYRFVLTDSFGIYISDSNPENVQQRKVFSEIDRVKEMIRQNRDQIILKTPEEESIVSAWYLERPGLYIIMIRSLAEHRQTLLRITLLIILSAAVSSAFLILIQIRVLYRMSDSFSEFYNQTSRVAGGDYTTPVRKQTFQEFTLLGKDFNRMLEDIRRRDTQLQKKAFYDELTSLRNRPYFIQELNRLLEDPETTWMAVVLADVDNFRIINETYDHAAGDHFLKILAGRLKYFSLTAARTGGDEFALILKENAPCQREFLKNGIEELNRLLQEPVLLGRQKIPPSVSMGISLFPDDAVCASSLLQAADLSLGAAKKEGKKTFRFFDKEMKTRLTRRVLLENEMRLALGREEFALHYQPQIHLRDSSIRGFEALIRWNSPVLGAVSPEEFIPLAEETGMILDLGEWVIRRTCRDMHTVNCRTASPYLFCINISPIQIFRMDLVKSISEAAAENGTSPAALEVEITENLLFDYTERNLQQLQQMKEMGIKISLDDFGTGYSSLSYLNNLPFDTLKIDKSFMTDLKPGSHNDKLIRTVIAMAGNLGLEVIAEGIETGQQLNLLKQMNCDIVQGFFTGKPMPLDDLKEFISTSESGAQAPRHRYTLPVHP